MVGMGRSAVNVYVHYSLPKGNFPSTPSQQNVQNILSNAKYTGALNQTSKSHFTEYWADSTDKRRDISLALSVACISSSPTAQRW